MTQLNVSILIAGPDYDEYTEESEETESEETDEIPGKVQFACAKIHTRAEQKKS